MGKGRDKMENIFKLNITQEEINEVRIFMNEKKQKLASQGKYNEALKYQAVVELLDTFKR